MTQHTDYRTLRRTWRERIGPLAGLTTALVAALVLLAAVCAPSGAIGLGETPDLNAAAKSLGIDVAAPVAGEGVALKGAKARTAARRADTLRGRARDAQRARQFTRASTLYDRARDLYLAAGKTRKARACLTAIQDIFLVTATYSETRDEMLLLLEATYPDSTPAERAAWLDLPSSESMRWDGVKHYFYDLPTNLAYRDVALFHTQTAMVDAYRTIYNKLAPYLAVGAATPAWEQYGEPHAYDFRQTLDAPRDQLPASGDLRVWFPLPIEGGPQTAVRIDEITPTTWLRYPPSTGQRIGLLFMRVPLRDLGGDLQASFRVRYQHAAQYFKVDPELVGSYDRSSALYRRYTESRGNTRITPSIRRTARRVVGAETNPYLAAQRLYDFVVSRVTYSHMPHLALWPRGIPESVYVHKHKYGDCGAQSMYFSALCRSIGIPARTPGGFQTFMGTPAGHFWAEFYLPNYGWVPVDPTAATMADYVPGLTVEEVDAFHDFYFASQDDLRLVVQRDTDLPLIPVANGRVLVPMAIQMPAAICTTMEAIPGAVLSGYWTFE